MLTDVFYQVNEVPCVVEAGVENFSKTKQAVTLMKAIGAYDDVEKAKESRKVNNNIYLLLVHHFIYLSKIFPGPCSHPIVCCVCVTLPCHTSIDF